MKNWLFISIFFLFIHHLSAQINSSPETPETNNQYKPKSNNSDKFFNKENFVVGGGLGLGFGNLFTSFSISPEVGYHIYPDRIVLGTRFFYNYYRDKVRDYSYNIIGGGPFVRGYIWRGLMAQVEYEYTFIKDFPFNGGLNGNTIYRNLNLSGFLVGGGFHQNFESGPGFYFIVLFNVVQSNDWIYPNPVFRTGFTYTFKKN
jgi:hypothetical protein